MSDDLISRKALMEGRVENDPVRIAAMCADTAFDKEKVIEELRQEAMHELGIPEERFNLDEGEYSSYCSISFSQAKRIVEKGGIE